MLILSSELASLQGNGGSLRLRHLRRVVHSTWRHSPRPNDRVFLPFRPSPHDCAFCRVDELFATCAPHREGLCLFGNPDGTWHVGPPSYEVPPVIPEPCNGINCPRDSLDVRCVVVHNRAPRQEAVQKLSWLAFVCVHAESWLLSVALFRSFCLTHKQRSVTLGSLRQTSHQIQGATLYHDEQGDTLARDSDLQSGH